MFQEEEGDRERERVSIVCYSLKTWIQKLKNIICERSIKPSCTEETSIWKFICDWMYLGQMFEFIDFMSYLIDLHEKIKIVYFAANLMLFINSVLLKYCITD